MREELAERLYQAHPVRIMKIVGADIDRQSVTYVEDFMPFADLPTLTKEEWFDVADECIRQMEWTQHKLPRFGSGCSQRPWWVDSSDDDGSSYGGPKTIFGGSEDEPDIVAEIHGNLASSCRDIAKLIVESVNLRSDPLTLAPPDWQP